MGYRNLEEAIRAAGSPVELLRHSQLGPYVYPVVPPEFSNWRDEQRAWRETCVLFNQSYHMADMWITGPDAVKLLSATGINSFTNAAVNKAKQFVGCNHDGHVIGDGILFYLGENEFLLVGRPSIHNWVQYHAEMDGYDVSLSRDERSIARDVPIVRRLYRYREWLPGTSYEATASLGGSFYSNRIDDYYLTPWDLGYGFMVKFDHDFIGRDALEQVAKNPRRRKVTLAWNGQDVTQCIGSMFQPGDPGKAIDLPLTNYASMSYDRVIQNGKVVGFSTFSSYSFNERSMLSMGIIDNEYSEVGTELTMVWGEEHGGSSKPTVERHTQMDIRVTVGPVPYAEPARMSYAAGWRTPVKAV